MLLEGEICRYLRLVWVGWTTEEVQQAREYKQEHSVPLLFDGHYEHVRRHLHAEKKKMSWDTVGVKQHRCTGGAGVGLRWVKA